MTDWSTPTQTDIIGDIKHACEEMRKPTTLIGGKCPNCGITAVDEVKTESLKPTHKIYCLHCRWIFEVKGWHVLEGGKS